MSINGCAKIGIKQVMRLEWLDYALEMVVRGFQPSEIREKLDEYLRDRMQRGGFGERGKESYSKAVAQIMKSWVVPNENAQGLREDAVALAKKKEVPNVVLHWAMVSVAYPFFFLVSEQVGRLLSLQENVTQAQIRLRCFENMGETTTVERSARRVIRTLEAWGILKDTSKKGCYEKGHTVAISSTEAKQILAETMMIAAKKERALCKHIFLNPAFFPFCFLGDVSIAMACGCKRFSVDRLSTDEDYVSLKM